MYYTQKVRSNVIIDPQSSSPKELSHGRVAWLQIPGRTVREMVLWDVFEKKFLPVADFKEVCLKRAAANRQRHALTPFGRKALSTRRKEVVGHHIGPSLLGWDCA